MHKENVHDLYSVHIHHPSQDVQLVIMGTLLGVWITFCVTDQLRVSLCRTHAVCLFTSTTCVDLNFDEHVDWLHFLVDPYIMFC